MTANRLPARVFLARSRDQDVIRSESISSSWIEGNRISPKRLAIAEILHEGSRVALDVVANVRATEAAIADLADRDRAITTEDIEQLQHLGNEPRRRELPVSPSHPPRRRLG